MKPPKSWALNLLKGEYKQSEVLGRLLLVAAVFNIPIYGFIPYLSQVITVVILSIFLKKYTSLFSQTSKTVTTLCIGTMVLQLFWFPYLTQLVTLVLVGILYGVFTKYKEKEG
jgi:chromate transport protein ChrA